MVIIAISSFVVLYIFLVCTMFLLRKLFMGLTASVEFRPSPIQEPHGLKDMTILWVPFNAMLVPIRFGPISPYHPL